MRNPLHDTNGEKPEGMSFSEYMYWLKDWILFSTFKTKEEIIDTEDISNNKEE